MFDDRSGSVVRDLPCGDEDYLDWLLSTGQLEVPDDSGDLDVEVGLDVDVDRGARTVGADASSGSGAWAELPISGVLVDLLAAATCGVGADGARADGAGAGGPVAAGRAGGPGERVERIVAYERVIAWTQALQIREVAAHAAAAESAVADKDACRALESVGAEMACALRLSQLGADRRVAEAMALADRCPRTLAALQAGRISLAGARAILEETENLPPQLAAAVEAEVVATAGERTPGRIRAATRRAVLRCDPEAARRRHAEKKADRDVTWWSELDGMARFSASVTAPDAAAMFAVLDAFARTADPEDPRRIGARRADALVDLILGRARTGAPTGPAGSSGADAATTSAQGPPSAGSPRPGVGVQLHVTVPAGTLLGLAGEPAHLAGYGPIPTDMARALAAEATWRRILTDPASGAVLDVGRTRYRPPVAIAEHVIARDRTCRFPGCRTAAVRCDLDHTIPFPHGPTAVGNLAALCRRHHRVKSMPGWACHQHHGDGTLVWTAPTGHTYRTNLALE